MIETGFTSTTFRPIKDKRKIVDIAVRANVHFIEWGGDIHVKSEKDAYEAQEICSANNIKISSYGSYYNVGSRDKSEFEKICTITSAMGADTIRVWLGNKGSNKTTKDERKELLEDAHRICRTAKEYSLKVAPECHPGTFNDNTDAFLDFAKELDEDNFRTYFQSLYRNLSYDMDRINRTLEYTDNVHISFSECSRMQILHKQNKDFIPLILGKYKDTGFKGRILLEYTYFSLPSMLIHDMSELKARLDPR